MDDVQCTGSETAIADCPSEGPEDQNCGHSEDAGVVCRLDEGKIGFQETYFDTILQLIESLLIGPYRCILVLTSLSPHEPVLGSEV